MAHFGTVSESHTKKTASFSLDLLKTRPILQVAQIAYLLLVFSSVQHPIKTDTVHTSLFFFALVEEDVYCFTGSKPQRRPCSHGNLPQPRARPQGVPDPTLPTLSIYSQSTRVLGMAAAKAACGVWCDCRITPQLCLLPCVSLPQRLVSASPQRRWFAEGLAHAVHEVVGNAVHLFVRQATRPRDHLGNHKVRLLGGPSVDEQRHATSAAPVAVSTSTPFTSFR